MPIPQNDRYQQHDQSLYSLWMHFVDYCIVTTEATKQFNNNYQAILTAASRGDHESVNNMLPCYSALDDYYNKHTNLPRLSVFVALSRANGKEYNSDELTEEMVKIEKETCEIEHGNSVPKVSLQFTKRSQNSTDQKSNLNRSFRNANSNNKREEFIKSSWCKNYDLCSNHYCKTESEFCNYDEYNGLSKMDHTLVQGNKSEYFDASFTSKEDYLPFPHINYPKIAKRDSNNLKYREDFTSNGMLYSEDKRYPLERTFSTDSLSSRDSFVSYNPNCAPATICDEFHYNLLRESFGMTDRESKSVDRFHCDKQIVLRHNPSPIQCLQSSKGIATGYDREIIFEDNFEMDCSIDRELMNIITPNFLKCEDGNHNFILGGLNASTTSATKALSPTANEFVPSQW